MEDMISVLGLLLLRIVLLLSSPAFSRPTVIKRRVEALVGSSTAIGCNSSGPIVFWHEPLGGQKTLVYINGTITSSYEASGFGMETTQEFGKVTLVGLIPNVTTDMAGKFLCEKLVEGEIDEETELVVHDDSDSVLIAKHVEVIPPETTMNDSVEPQGERENDTEVSASAPPPMDHLVDKQTSVSQKENEHWTPSTIGFLILGILPYVVIASYLFTRMRRKRMFARERIPTCEQGSQTDESSMYSTTNL